MDKKLKRGQNLSVISFNENYKKIIEPVKNNLDKLDEYFSEYFSNRINEKNHILPIIKDFLSNRGKRIRPVLIFLMLHALNRDIDDFLYKLALANELIHNATLIHDDIIDCSIMRRGEKTINFNYDSKLAVLAGDYLLSEVLKLLADTEDKNIRKIHSDAVSKIIKGELNQYFNRFKILSIEQYIEKSKDKTARLFEAGLVSAYIYNTKNADNIDKVKDFALNFGIAFQIYNDLENLSNPEKLNEDVQNGDYSAPLIFFAQEKYGEDVKSLNNVNQALKQIKNTDAVSKTKELAKYYINLAIENVSFLEDNLYKQAIIEMCTLYAQTYEMNNDG